MCARIGLEHDRAHLVKKALVTCALCDASSTSLLAANDCMERESQQFTEDTAIEEQLRGGSAQFHECTFFIRKTPTSLKMASDWLSRKLSVSCPSTTLTGNPTSVVTTTQCESVRRVRHLERYCMMGKTSLRRSFCSECRTSRVGPTAILGFKVCRAFNIY